MNRLSHVPNTSVSHHSSFEGKNPEARQIKKSPLRFNKQTKVDHADYIAKPSEFIFKNINDFDKFKPIDKSESPVLPFANVMALVDLENFNINSKNAKGQSLLTLLIFANNFCDFETLLIEKTTTDSQIKGKLFLHVNSQDKFGLTALHYACKLGLYHYVEALIRAGCNVNLGDNANRSPLSFACIKGNTDIVKILLDAGAQANCADTFERTPLSHASEKGHTKVVSLLHDNAADVEYADLQGKTPLIYACKNGHATTVSALIKDGAKVNSRDNKNSTSLMHSCKNGHLKIASVLIEAGADVNLSNYRDETPLFISAFKGHTQCLALLLMHDANINHQNRFKQTPLMMACIENNNSCVKLLLHHFHRGEATINVNLTDDTKKSALHYAYAGRQKPNVDLKINTTIIKMLLDHEINVNLQDNKGYTILMYAAYHGTMDLIKPLVHAGIDISLRTHDGRSAIAMAKQKKQYQFITQLKSLTQRENLIFSEYKSTITTKKNITQPFAIDSKQEEIQETNKQRTIKETSKQPPLKRKRKIKTEPKEPPLPKQRKIYVSKKTGQPIIDFTTKDMGQRWWNNSDLMTKKAKEIKNLAKSKQIKQDSESLLLTLHQQAPKVFLWLTKMYISFELMQKPKVILKNYSSEFALENGNVSEGVLGINDPQVYNAMRHWTNEDVKNLGIKSGLSGLSILAESTQLKLLLPSNINKQLTIYSNVIYIE